MVKNSTFIFSTHTLGSGPTPETKNYQAVTINVEEIIYSKLRRQVIKEEIGLVYEGTDIPQFFLKVEKVYIQPKFNQLAKFELMIEA